MINHIAFIMDGNGRYATNLGKNRSYGHKVGFENMVKIIKFLATTDIKYASFYAFSTENWNRPQAEVDYLMTIPSKINSESLKELDDLNVKINFLGLKTRVPLETLESIEKIVERTSNNTGLVVNIMFDYGFKQELVDAVNELVILNKKVSIDDINEHLYTRNMPYIDLLIRTGGEYRLSNFMLLQLAYAELFFTSTYWPVFAENELKLIIDQFEKRERRFGGIK